MQRTDWATPEALTRAVRSILRRRKGAAVDLFPFSLQVDIPSMGGGAGTTAPGQVVRVPADYDFLWYGVTHILNLAGVTGYQVRIWIDRLNRYLGSGARINTGDDAEGWMELSINSGTGQLPRLFAWPILLHAGDNTIWEGRTNGGGPGRVATITLLGYAIHPPTRGSRQ